MKKYLAIALSVFFSVGVISCGGGGDDSSGGGDNGAGTTITAAEANDVASAVVNTTMTVLSVAMGGGANPSASKAVQVTPAKSDYTVAEASSCGPVTLRADLGSQQMSQTINGTDIAADGSGSLQVSVYGDNQETIIVEAMYNELNLGSAYNNTSLDGLMQLISEITSQSVDTFIGSVTIFSNDFMIGLIESGSTKICTIDAIEIIQEVFISLSQSSVTWTSDVHGCMTINGESFSVSGYDTGTSYAPSGY